MVELSMLKGRLVDEMISAAQMRWRDEVRRETVKVRTLIASINSYECSLD